MSRISTLLLLVLLAISATTINAQIVPVPPDVQTFLVPLAPFNAANGAYGSVWHGELTLFNGNSQQATVFATVCPPIINSCFGNSFAVASQTTVRPELYSAGYEGTFISVAPSAAEKISLQYRIQDMSRQAQTWGTTIPIVPISQFRRSIELLEVPTDDRFRVNLRVYSLQNGLAAARVRVRSSSGGTVFSERTIQLTGNAPAYASTNPIDSSIPDARVRIEITQEDAPQSPIWAFASITNNETQHVTIIAP